MRPSTRSKLVRMLGWLQDYLESDIAGNRIAGVKKQPREVIRARHRWAKAEAMVKRLSK